MTSSLAFDISAAEEDLETEALKELNAFLASPHSIGLDNLKEVLRNTVQLMMELKGYATGYAVHHLANGEHSYLALAGVLKTDEDKRRKWQELQELMERLEQMMARQFERIFGHVENKIKFIESKIEDQIEQLEEEIEDALEDEKDAQIIEVKKKKRNTLKHFMGRLNQRKQKLAKVDTTEDVIEIEAEVTQDVADLNNGSFNPSVSKPSSFDIMKNIIQSRRKNKALEEEYTNTPTSLGVGLYTPSWAPESSSSDDDSDSGDTGDSSSSGEDDNGGDEKDKDVEPPTSLDF